MSEDVASRFSLRDSGFRYAEFARWRGTKDHINALFFDFLDRFKDDLIPRYGTEALGVESLDTDDVYDEILPLHPQLQEIHEGKMSLSLTERLVDAGLLISQRYRWSPDGEGPVYKCQFPN